MRTIITAVIFTLVAALSPTHAIAQESDQLQTLVDQLTRVTEKARRERAADRWLLNELEELVASYSWPWRDQLVMEDFSDGDFRQNPAWQVRSGQFWVDGRLGLRSRSSREPERVQEEEQPRQRQSNEDIGKALFGALLQGALQGKRKQAQEPQPEPQQQNRYEPSEIQLPMVIPSVFAADLEFSIHNAPSEDGQVEFGLYQGAEGSSGYKLVIYTGRRPSLELHSIRSGRTGVIDRVEIDDLNDGNSHQLQWRRDGKGQIEVLLNGTSLFKARDHSFRYPFKQFAIGNLAGDLAVANVSIFGGK